jgi:hypothetical protein
VKSAGLGTYGCRSLMPRQSGWHSTLADRHESRCLGDRATIIARQMLRLEGMHSNLEIAVARYLDDAAVREQS